MGEYKYPYLVLYSMKVPKMCCQRCQKEKDGLVYITNLIDEAQTVLNRKVLAEMKRVDSDYPS